MKFLTGLSLLATATFLSVPATAQTLAAGDNPEIATLFTADQSVRENIKPEQIKDRAFVTRMIDQDRTRRERTLILLKEGHLQTANDLYRAAFIFQHGNTPDHYLLAHSLALASAAKGNKEASWIAAATLDRYLQTIGQKQIYGTQYLSSRETGPTMEPYDRNLIPDSLRAALGVPSQAKQDERLTKMKAGATLAK